MNTIHEPCDQCEGSVTHPFPAPNTPVTVVAGYETREVGDDNCTPVKVKAGQTAVAVDYVAEWHDVDLHLPDGKRVWMDPANLTWEG